MVELKANDFVWIVVILVNLGGSFIITEPSALMYRLIKWCHVHFPIGKRIIFSFSKGDVVVAVLLYVVFFAGEGAVLVGFFASALLFYTGMALYKIANAFGPNQKVVQETATVKEAFVFQKSDSVISKEYILVKVDLPGWGERVLPPIPYAPGSEVLLFRVGNKIRVSCHQGSLGRLYRFSFTNCW